MRFKVPHALARLPVRQPVLTPRAVLLALMAGLLLAASDVPAAERGSEKAGSDQTPTDKPAKDAPEDKLDIRISGIKDPLLTNVRNRLETFRLSRGERLSRRRVRALVDNMEKEAASAVRPYGFYHATVSSEIIESNGAGWRINLHIDRGPPVTIVNSEVVVSGAGAGQADLRDWQKDWPLTSGKRLNQITWEAQKSQALELATSEGYLSARFVRHRIELDLEKNEARTELELDTGPLAVMGTITFNQDAVKPGVLERLPRFKPGQAYDAWLLEKFRLDLWQTGYFDDVEMIEERRLEENPPQVNLLVTARTRPRNTYQGSLGFGTDTKLRAQVNWSRHLLSKRGDSLDVGLGWQQKNEEYSFKTSYRLPRLAQQREFWTADFQVRKENQDLKVKSDDSDADFIELTNGDVIDYSLKPGKLIVRDLARGYQQIYETWYAQYVLEKSTFNLRDFTIGQEGIELQPDELNELRDTGSSIALGVNWDWPVIRGNAFDTSGHHERAWIFTAQKAWGSEKEFTQAYASSNWHLLMGEHWKLLLRGELGYTDAEVAELKLDVDGVPLELSATSLPNLYRFKAGGSRSVRGYAFEELDNNGIGSNNIVTASAEVEFNFRPDWSVAAFVDVGNAFNDWNDMSLKRGVGVGVRWYSIAGPVRVDIAQALDIEGNPWRLHFTIGTPLL